MSDANSFVTEGQVAWAHEQLGLDSSPSQSEIRRAFFMRLAESEFVPDEFLRQAMQTLRDGNEAVAARSYKDVERSRLDEAVDDFSECLFRLSTQDRREKWKSLWGRADCSPIAAMKLERLEIALDLEVTGLELRAEVAELAEYLCELFTLLPSKRAQRRAAIVNLHEEDMKLWERAAQRIKSSHPTIAALDSPLIERFANWSRSQKVMRKPPPIKGPPKIKIKKRVWHEDLAEHPWLIAVVLIILANIGRMVATTPTSNPIPRNLYRTPATQPYGSSSNNAIRQRQIDALRQMQESINQGKSASDPSRIQFAPLKAKEDSGQRHEPSVPDQEVFQQLESRYPIEAMPSAGSRSDTQTDATPNRELPPGADLP